MNDDYAQNKISKYFSWLGMIFDLPIAEIIDKRHHGMLFFSKIKLEAIHFIYGLKQTDFILDPIQITYYDYIMDEKKKVWHERYFKLLKNKVDTTDSFLKRIHMRNAVFKWMNRERIDLFSIIDLGPLVAIKNDNAHVLNEEELSMYSQSINDDKKKMKMLDEKEMERKKKMLLSRRFKSLIRKPTINVDKKKQKYLYLN
jgi:hypothetical protein